MKKMELIIVGVVFVIIGIIAFFVVQANRITSTITIDINPSVEIELNKDNKVMNVNALNTDARKVVVKKDSLNETVEAICEKVVEEGFVEEGDVSVLVYASGEYNPNDLDPVIKEAFNKQEINANVIVIEEVTEEDKAFAKKNNISIAKAAYINSISDENVDKTKLINKPVNEISEAKERGTYCDKGYTLEGDFCLKEKNREPAKTGEICPSGYYEVNGTCYKEEPAIKTGNYFCNSGYVIENNECVKRETFKADPEYSCSKGELAKKGDLFTVGIKDNEKMVCVDKSTGKAPTQRCLLNSGHIIIGGVCYNGPAPTINGGCPNGDTLRNGWCYSRDDGDQYQCPDGNIYEKSKNTFVELCPDTFTYYEPTIEGYKCPEGATLEGTKCTRVTKEEIQEEMVCPIGYSFGGKPERCVDRNNSASKVSGYYCDMADSRLRGKECVIYEIIPANKFGEE